MMAPRLILAPLMGITGATFRRLFNRHFPGFTGALAPFITTTHGNPAARSHFKDILPENNQNSLPLTPQLIGRDGPDFISAANRLSEEFGFAEINWNIGCPSGTVTAKRRGAGLLPYPELIDGFLDHVCARITCRLSIKMRIGMNDPLEYRPLIPILNRYPIAEITIHPRTGSQMYKGTVDLAAFAECFAALNKPVIYNGDITTTAFAQQLIDRFPGLAGLMIGRGAIANPFLPQAIRSGVDECSLVDRARIKTFHDDLVATYEATLKGGALPILSRMKELWAYWLPFTGSRKTMKKILKAKRMDEYRSAVASAFSEEGVGAD
jgi:tRNA-dihydrouridine synthase B